MKTSDFDYPLPPELIAQAPIKARDQSRFMVIDRSDGSIKHRRFFEIVDYLRAGDVLVFNDSRVIPARLVGNKVESGGRLEILLLRRLSPNVWETLVRPAKRVKAGTRIEITCGSSDDDKQDLMVVAEVVGLGEGGIRALSFSDETRLSELGKVPLPPYIHRPLSEPERYQTVYASVDGSVAAPTAGLHLTTELIDKLKAKGVRCLFITLHIGLDTFQPVRVDEPLEHPIHQEYGIINQEAADELSRARLEGRRIICVGTTTVRLIEAVAQTGSLPQIQPFEGWVDLFIVPGYRFRAVDAMVTNFHLPRTTLLMLVTAFAGRDLINQAYQEAIARQYRFYSFGDAMLVL
ncbi:tRNA preQ1(34) S-adenosylmethionine ribosyltransferase-isomerase QueA [Chloroflexota bacterium]